ncbi:MAG: 1-acyl-sn-glycerol-3-phosphate acyltransferase [Deltaproteobacteria bacterium]|nr:1-acyl-sn-glycerol-3-phosphate acyltransferase [Deltaproteobacteria bacterium]
MDGKTLALLRLQILLGQLAAFVLGPLYFLVIRLLGYRIRELSELRRRCAREFAKHKGPWIFCPNHLTMIDSAIVAYAMMPLHRQLFQYRRIPWNLPERDNFYGNPFLVVLCYLMKCIPLQRGGNREKIAEVLEKCTYLLQNGHALTIFPEGHRSRTGRIDRENFSYGVGRFIKDLDNCKVMCLYLRGDSQSAYGTIPRFGERFTVLMESFVPERLDSGGLRAQRGYAAQIIGRLAEMEESYFDTRGQRYRGPEGAAEPGQERGYALSGTGLHR